MKSKLTNLLLFTLCIPMISSPLTSCKKDSAYNPDNFLANGSENNPYQIVKEQIEIEVFAPKSAGSPAYDSMKMFKKLSELTNIKFKFTTPDSSAYATVRSGIWGGDEIPDLFLFNNSISEIVQFAEKGFNVYVPFNDDSFSYKVGSQTIEVGNLIDNYMPNYKTLLNNNFNIDLEKGNAKEIATLTDGKMYSSLSVKDVARDLTYKMFINQQWIDNLNENYGLELPNADEIETLDQYYQVLKAFKDYDANDNGDNSDEIPVTAKSMEYLRNYILQAYGYVCGGIEIKNDWSSYEFVPLTPQYREYLKFANKLYKEGILHKNTFSISTDAQMANYGMNEDAGLLGCFVAAAPYLIVGYDRENQYTTIGPVRDSSYTGEKIQYGLGYFSNDGACISQRSKYIREIARLLDIMYSPIGQQLISYGIEGEDFTWDNEEKTSWTFNVPSTWTGNQEQYRATITPNVGSGSALYWSNDFVGKMNDTIIKKLNEQSSIYTPYLKVAEPKEIKMTEHEYSEITIIKASLDSQLEFIECSFIKGSEGYDINNDNDYNKNLINKLKGYRCDELLKYYNDSLARYKSR